MGPLSAPGGGVVGGGGGLGSAWWGFTLGGAGVKVRWAAGNHRNEAEERVEIHVTASDNKNSPPKCSQCDQTSATCCPSRSRGFTAWFSLVSAPVRGDPGSVTVRQIVQ